MWSGGNGVSRREARESHAHGLMKRALMLSQVIVALGIYSVWLVRYDKPTRFRGRGAKSLRKEFAAYGLPSWAMYAVGSLKLGSATLLLLGLGYPRLVRPAAVSMAALMAGAVSMHLKVKDPLLRSMPALTMLGLSTFVALNAAPSRKAFARMPDRASARGATTSQAVR